MTFIPEKKQVETMSHPAMPADNFEAGTWKQATERLRSKQAELRAQEDIARATERLARFNRDWRRSCLTARVADSTGGGS
jgi:hypothetical protein